MKNDKTKIIFFGLVSTVLSLILIEIFFTFFLLIFSQEYHPIIKYYSSKNSPEFLTKRIPNKSNYYSINYFCLTNERGPPTAIIS